MATLLGLLSELFADGPPPAGTRVGVTDSKGEYVIEFGEAVPHDPIRLVSGHYWPCFRYGMPEDCDECKAHVETPVS